MGHKVTAPYVTLRAPNELGQEILTGFYAGAVLPEGVNQDDLDRHVRKGMVAEEGTPEAEAASPVGKPVTFDVAGMPVEPKPVGAEKPKKTARTPAGPGSDGEQPPAGNASREDWAAHAKKRGAPDDETRAVEEGGLSRDDLRAKYGA